MNDLAPLMRRGVNAAMLASFDLALDEQIRHAREMLGRHEHDAKRMEALALAVAAMKDAHQADAERLRAFVDYLEAQKSDRQQQGSTVAGGLAP